MVKGTPQKFVIPGSDNSKFTAKAVMIQIDAVDFASVISNPFKFVDDIFQLAESALESSSTDWGEESFLTDVCENVKDQLEPDGSGLVRICGMITESKGKEFYSGVYRDPHTQIVRLGKYRDLAPVGHLDRNSQRLFSREIFVISEIPGLNDWLKCSSPYFTSNRLYLKVVENGKLPKVGQLVDIIAIRSRESPSIVHQIWSQEFTPSPSMKSPSNLVSVRGDLIHFLAHALGNDYTSAQYVLLHMLSRVHSRLPQQNIIVGNFPVHLQPLTDEVALIATSRIRDLYSLLLPFTTSFDLSIEALSSLPAINPRMDYESEELVSGPLYLVPGTVLILDQTKMEPGKLEPHALHNLKTLQRLASEQMLAFDFMYDVDFEMDIPVVVIAKEQSTLVPTQYRIGIGGVDPLPEYVDYRIDDGILESWRQYILSARAISVQLPEHVSARAKQDFLNHNIKVEQMHRVLNLARLLAASHLETEISESIWNASFLLEMERLSKSDPGMV